RRRVVGFQLDFNMPLDATAAQNQANYGVVEMVKHGRKTLSRPVRFQAVYDASSHAVKLLLTGRPRFAQGGQITVSAPLPTGVNDAAGYRVTLIVSRGARGVSS